ncbi:hypothetical protein C0039_16155 [Pseudohalioglobus lutimaris]|uniref:TNase-like domain-containing protein n=1 Tax=Pseudohalioglobus lutimaris TaxID=1737061 RepID=A0A2N5WZH0_9GAMM|nr:hypothetical protein C0039_16155 [Pseudohalioglobus lutimaris]
MRRSRKWPSRPGSTYVIRNRCSISKRKQKTAAPRLITPLKVAVLAAVFSIYQYATTGKISWITTVYESVESRVSGYASRPDAGWRKAADAIEDLGATREAVPTRFDITGKVVRVVDGDTLHVFEGEGVQTRIHLYGIDAPETDQPYYNGARDALALMVAGESVGVTVVDTDWTERTVGTVYLDGKSINLEMVRAGHAWWYRKQAQYDRPLQEAERQASLQKLGLWGNADPVPPWDWKRGKR